VVVLIIRSCNVCKHVLCNENGNFVRRTQIDSLMPTSISSWIFLLSLPLLCFPFFWREFLQSVFCVPKWIVVVVCMAMHGHMDTTGSHHQLTVKWKRKRIWNSLLLNSQRPETRTREEKKTCVFIFYFHGLKRSTNQCLLLLQRHYFQHPTALCDI